MGRCGERRELFMQTSVASVLFPEIRKTSIFVLLTVGELVFVDRRYIIGMAYFENSQIMSW